MLHTESLSGGGEIITRYGLHTCTLPPQDILLMMGYAQDEAEEVIGRVLSVIDSTEHFLDQSIAVLNEVSTFVV